MPYIEFTAPPASGKTTEARRMIEADPGLHPGRRSLGRFEGRARVNRLGLPPDGLRMWLRLLAGLPQDVGMALRFLRQSRGPIRKRLRRTRGLLQLLVKARALASSPKTWVVDQGLQQLILSCCVDGIIDTDIAGKIMLQTNSGPWRPTKLEVISTPKEVLLSRISNSEKHISQTRKVPIVAYVDRYVDVFESLSR